MKSFIIPIILILLLVEISLQLSWASFYFRYGIPAYTKKYPFPGSLKDPFDIAYLEKYFSTARTCTIYFRRFNAFECGFREKLWEIRLLNYVPVMRGVIRGDEKSGSFYIIGYLNWYVFIFAAHVSLAAALGVASIWAPLMLLLGIIYLVQFFRFTNVAEVAYEWLKKNK